jgi:hypothetical protein
MPLVNGKPMSPDDAMKQDRCPECGQDLKESNPIAHLRSHWRSMPRQDRDGEEGLRRMTMFKKYIADHDIRTSDMPKKAAPPPPPPPPPPPGA